MAYVDFLQAVHRSTQRDYLGRVTAHDKAECAEIAGRFGREYWDGERHLGYGGYRYDGRWRAVAEAMVSHYQLPPDARILDVGCGKGFLLFELLQVLPQATIAGLDISRYALDHAPPEVQPFLVEGTAASLPFADQEFDFVVSLNTLHNLPLAELWSALQQIERVGRDRKYLVVESYRSEREKVNLLYWQLTCRAFFAPEDWEFVFRGTGYRGDHSFIYFE
ncbi:MAG: class I SAM-dependent methyltransferase [Planctomycetaceae bacterium]|nr:class I SAM-dependent methyltransferase [Planctomycetaceae bacterium]